MPTSRLTDILHVKHAAFLIAVLTTSLAMESSRSAEVIPATSDRSFNDYPGVVSKRTAGRSQQELAQFEPLASNALKNRSDSSNDSAFASGVLKVRFDDRGPGQSVPEDHRGSASAETPTTRTTVVSPVHQEEREPANPGRISPVATATGKPVHDKGHDGPMWTPWLLIIFVIAALVVIWRILRRLPPNGDEESQAPESNIEIPPSYPLRIAIKLNSSGGKPPQQLDGWQASLEGTAKPLAPLRLSPFFESQDLNRLSELIARAKRNDPDYEPPDFSAWFQVETPAGVKAEELAKRLRKLDNVETAYVMRPAPPPMPVSFTNDPRNLKQGYQDAAPKGIDARYAWGFLGGDGAGIGFVDLEQGWNLNHDDLKDANITIISGINMMYRTHGTSVLGIVLMVDNKEGGVGIAPSAKGRVISQWRPESSRGSPMPEDVKNTAKAIFDAAYEMSPGDVLLIEAQESDPIVGVGNALWPVEIEELTYHKIRLATALGIVVVEAGGNGGFDLDTYTDEKGRKIFDRSFRDSRAIMVGAGSSTHPHHRVNRSNRLSNHGYRIDCYAWGENIDTTKTTKTDGAPTSNTRYTTHFGGTSGASAIVAGAALIVQGIGQAAQGRRFSPRELRTLLTTNGTPSATPDDRIGVMPDLRAIITKNQLTLAPIPSPGPS